MVELGKTIEASQSYQNSVELGTARCSHRSLAELIGSGHNWAVFLVVGRAWRSSTERNFWKLKAPKGVQWSLWSSNELAGNFELVRARQRLRRSLDLRRALWSPMQLGRLQLSSSALGGACRSFLELGKNRWSLRSPVKLDRAIRARWSHRNSVTLSGGTAELGDNLQRTVEFGWAWGRSALFNGE